MAASSYRFRPRFRALPWLLVAVSAYLLAAVPLYPLVGQSRVFALVCGALGPLIALGYWYSPAWRLIVEIDDTELRVRRGDSIRLRLPWSDVVKVHHSPEHHTLFIDGGSPGKSLLVPGPGRPGPYRIERQEQLCEAVLARVPSGTVLTHLLSAPKTQ